MQQSLTPNQQKVASIILATIKTNATDPDLILNNAIQGLIDSTTATSLQLLTNNVIKC